MDEFPPFGAPGQRLGRYELLQRIAVGGMAEVYRAHSLGQGDFRKLVAIKRLLPQHALDPQLLRMFLDESRLMARFAHANLPHVIDVNDGGGVDVPYFAMEHVAGVDLREILRAARGPLPIEHIVAITAGIAAGLHHAHDLRADDGRPLEIVHRDVSPSNVLVSFDGGVKVTDFGVAKWLQQKSFTYQGQLKGKFAHMSPEQCRGEPLDRRSDVFALGTLLYEMATGRPPFEADTELELLSRIASHDAPWPNAPDSDVPADFGAIIMRALQRRRDDRFQTAQDLQIALEAWARDKKLVVSSVGLSTYVESLFASRVTEWRSSPSGSEDHAPPSTPGGRTATDTFVYDKPSLLGKRGEVAKPGGSGKRSTRGLLGVAAVVAAAIFGVSVRELARPADVASPAPSASETTAVRAAEPAATRTLAAGPTTATATTNMAGTTAATLPPAATATTATTSAAADRPGTPLATRDGLAEGRPDPRTKSARREPTPAERTKRAARPESPRLAFESARSSGKQQSETAAPVDAAPSNVAPPPAASLTGAASSATFEKRTTASTSRPVQPKIWDPDSPVPP